MPIPRPQELHLWLCRCDTLDDSDDFLRDILSRYVLADRRELQISRNAHGKPALLAPVAPLDFNLSDGGDWRILALSGGVPVGVDLEYCDPGRDVLRLARRFFTATELAQLQACPPAARADLFYDYWTLKEAHIKAGGGSLGRELERTGFALRYPDTAFAAGTAGFITRLAPVSSTPAWYGLLRAPNDYRIALCCLGRGNFAGGLRLFELPASGMPAEHAPALHAVSAVAGQADGVSSW